MSSWPGTGCSRGPAALMFVKQILLLPSVGWWERSHARLERSRLQVGCVKHFCSGVLPWLRVQYLACCQMRTQTWLCWSGLEVGMCSNFEVSCWQWYKAVQGHC